MSTDVFSRSREGVTNETSEKARRAVKNFRAMQPTLTSFARVLTGKPNVRVVMDPRSNGMTDGTSIFFRPPIALGDNQQHIRSLCDKRDDNLQLLCPACNVRESVLITIYHEIGHIAFDTFAETSEEDRAKMLERAVREHGSKYATALERRIAHAPESAKSSYLGMAKLISPFLPFLVNALDDSRVNRMVFTARKGTKVMFDADARRIFSEGVEQKDENGNVVRVEWRDYPLNQQAAVGLYCKASGYDYKTWFRPEVVAFLDDEVTTRLIQQVTTVRSVAGVFDLAFPILENARKFGFFKYETDPEVPEEEQEKGDEADSEGQDDQQESEPQGDDGDGSDSQPDDDSGAEAGDPSSDGEDGEGEGASSDGSGDGTEESAEGSPDDGGSDQNSEREGDRSENGDVDESGDSSESEGESGDDRGSDASESDSGESGSDGGDDAEGGSPEHGSSEGSSDAGNGEGLGDEAQDQDGSDSGSGADAGDDTSGDTGGDGQAAGEGLNDGTSDGTQNSAETSGEGTAGGPDDRGESGSRPEGDPSGDEVGSSVMPEASSPADSAGDAGEGLDSRDSSLEKGQDGDGSHPDDLASDDKEVESAGTSDEGSQHEGDGHADAADASGDGDEPVDSGADQGEGGTRVIENSAFDELPMGTPDDVERSIHEIAHPEDRPAFIQENGGKAEQEMDRAIIQGLYFETPSRNIFGVREHHYGDPIMVGEYNMSQGWDHKSWLGYGYGRRNLGIDGDFTTSESILGPALLRMRVAFSDNQRGKDFRNRKSGKVDARVLGKRAHHDDERLFKMRVLPKKKDYFVLIGIDISGSTIGKNIVLAKQAAYAQATLCHRLGIKFAVYAHSGNYHAPDGGRRSGFDLDIYHIKDPDEPWTEKVQERLHELGPDAANLDGHTMEFYRKILDKRTESHRVMLYYTDGKMPAENHDEELEILQREIKTCRRKKYTLVGVGIRTDSPTQHGLDTVQVNNEEDVILVVKHLEKRLLAL